MVYIWEDLDVLLNYFILARLYQAKHIVGKSLIIAKVGRDRDKFQQNQGYLSSYNCRSKNLK